MQELVRLDSVEFWDFDQQGGFNPASTGAGFEVRRGDAWAVDCYYGPMPDGSPRAWGYGSDDEMCIDFLYYSPRQAPPPPLPSPLPRICCRVMPCAPSPEVP